MKHTTNNSAKTMITIIIVPIVTKVKVFHLRDYEPFQNVIYFLFLIHPLSLFILNRTFTIFMFIIGRFCCLLAIVKSINDFHSCVLVVTVTLICLLEGII
jgi:hypothetical protein